MENLIEELKHIIPFKDTTEIGDIVLIVAKQPQMVLYGLVKDLKRDPGRKDEWWVVDLLLFSVPPQIMKWTLRTPQMTGMEVFTMGGEERFLKAVDVNKTAVIPDSLKPKTEQNKKKEFLRRVK